MKRDKGFWYFVFGVWMLLVSLFLGLHSPLLMFFTSLGCLGFSFLGVHRTKSATSSFETIVPFPSLSSLGEEQTGGMYCLFLESQPQGLFHEVLDQAGMDAMLRTANKKLVAYFGKKHVCRISRNQFVVIKEFETDKTVNYEERNAYLERISNYISLMLSSLITPANKEALRVAPLSLGSASSGIRYQARCVDDLIELAYFTMKLAQKEQRRYLVADEVIRARKLNTEECMEGFLRKNWKSEFTPFFQPIIDSKTNKVVGMESLARWQLGGVRLLDAKVFKDLAYEMARIEQIDLLIIEKTFEAAEKLHHDGIVPSDFRIVINLDASTLQVLSAQKFLCLINRYGLKASDVELDIKDKVLSNHFHKWSIQEFKKRSVRIALDLFDEKAFDLDALFSNQYDTIKLDYSNYDSKETDVSGRYTRLYPSLSSIASEYGVEILAKGIEKQEQMQAAKKHQVKYLQGNYFTPAIPFFAFQIFVKKYQDGLYLEEYILA